MLPPVSIHDLQPNYFIMRTIRKPIIHPLKLEYISSIVAHFTTRNSLNSSMIFTCNKTIQTRLSAATSSITHVERNVLIDYFLNYTPEDEETQAERAKQVNKLKEQVRKELLEIIEHKPKPELLKFLDSIQRIGLGYHFEDEIEEALNQLYETHCQRHGDNHDHDLDLYHAALKFRVLRQHGYYIQCDIFKQFLDDNGKFKETLISDVEGMLSLYEASHLRVHGDNILEEALTFTTSQLNLITSRLDHQLAMKVAHALEYPIHKTVARLGSRHYISQYEHNPLSKILLKFAKLDFNLLQALHKRELGDLTRWCYSWDGSTRLPYNVRDQVIIEPYFCALGAMDEHPRYSLGRIIYFKLLWVGAIIDDIYDILEIADLKLFTQALQRWDKECVNLLPDNLKFIYTILLDIFEEVQQHLANEGRSHIIHYAVESFKNVFMMHLQSSKWSREKYVPSFEAYMTIGTIATGGKFFPIVSYLGLGDIATQEVFEWAMKYPKVIQAFGKIARIEDDIEEDDPMEEEATEKPSAVSC